MDLGFFFERGYGCRGGISTFNRAAARHVFQVKVDTTVDIVVSTGHGSLYIWVNGLERGWMGSEVKVKKRDGATDT